MNPTAGEMLMHELVAHAIPRVTGVDRRDAIGNENRVRSEVKGVRLRMPEEHHGQ